jgi:hypothetical protein
LQPGKFDESVKSQKIYLLSFRPGSGSGMTAKPESSDFNMSWMPDQVRHDELGTFCEPGKFSISKYDRV